MIHHIFEYDQAIRIVRLCHSSNLIITKLLDTCLEKYIRTDNVFRRPENLIEIPKDLKSVIDKLNDCQEICSIMEACKSFEFSKTFYSNSKCLLYNKFVDEPEIVDDQKIGVDSFNRCTQGYKQKYAQNSSL